MYWNPHGQIFYLEDFFGFLVAKWHLLSLVAFKVPDKPTNSHYCLANGKLGGQLCQIVTISVHKTLLDAMSLYDVTCDSRGLLPGFYNLIQFFDNFRQNIGAPTPTHITIPDSSLIISEVRRQTVIQVAIYTIKFFCKCILLCLVKQSNNGYFTKSLYLACNNND